MRCCVLALLAVLTLAEAKFSPSKATMPTSDVAIKSHAEPEMSTIITSTAKKDVFKPVPTDEPLVGSIVTRFMTTYRKEIGHSSLEAEVAGIIKAESTEVRNEVQEKQVDAEGLGLDFVEETQSQQFRIFMLVKYKFDSSMLGRNRPYVTVMRLTMDCYNSTGDAAAAEPVETVEDDEPALPPSTLACDVLEHKNLPRRNESTKSVPTYIQRQIFHSAPASYIHNHTLNVYYDAVEAQDLAFDAFDRAMADRDTMHYVRFRVQGGNTQDCVIAIEHTAGINTLRFQDTACYEDADSNALAAASRMDLAKANAPLFVLIASIAGACVAMLLVWRQRRKQRSGYSYLHSNASKLSHVPGATGTTNTDAAVAC